MMSGGTTLPDKALLEDALPELLKFALLPEDALLELLDVALLLEDALLDDALLDEASALLLPRLASAAMIAASHPLQSESSTSTSAASHAPHLFRCAGCALR